MQTFTQCATCEGVLAITFLGQRTHPTCKQHPEEKLAREFCDAVQRGDGSEAARLEKLLNEPKVPSLGQAALWYAQNGWPVFPLLPGQKVPATKNGFKDASRDPSVIKRWWREDSARNIGVPTGPETFDCVDVDGPQGMESLMQLEAEGKIPDVHGRVSTPRGLHLLIKGSLDGNRVGVRPGIDLRSHLGYVVAAPSVVDGRRYTWTVQPSPEILKVS